MTVSEVEYLMQELKCVFEDARLVDVEKMEAYYLGKDGHLNDRPELCYAVWNKGKRCENCISAKACRSCEKNEKFEFSDDEIFHITSKPVEVDGKQYALEVISKVKNNLIVDSYGKDQFTAITENMNRRAYTDPLTGLYNKRYYDEHMFNLENESAVALLDIDNFKLVNDTYGHAAGDVVVKAVAEDVRAKFRDSDIVVRYGGDKFLIAFRSIPKDVFLKKMDEVRDSAVLIEVPGYPEIKLSLSIGCVYRDGDAKISFEDADKELFVAKGNKNAVAIEKELRQAVVNTNPRIKKEPEPVLTDSRNLMIDDQLMLLRSFSSDYHGILVADMKSGKVSVYQSKGDNAKWICEAVKDGYDEFRKKFADEFIYPNDRETFLDKTSIQSIRAKLEENEVYYLNHKIVKNGVPNYYQTKFVKDHSDPSEDRILIGGHSIDENRRSNSKSIEDMSNLHGNAVVEGLTKDFDFIGSLNVITKELRTFGINEKAASLIGYPNNVITNFDQAQEVICSLIIHNDLPKYKNESTLEAVIKNLADSGVYFVNYRILFEGEENYYQTKYVLGNDRYNIFLGIRSVDLETKNELKRLEQEKKIVRMQKDLDQQEQLEMIVTERTEELRERNQMLSRMSEEVIELLGNITEARDTESGEHIRRVKGFSHILADKVMELYPEYGLTKDKVNIIASASALHDIGKISIPDHILLKPGRLTAEEFNIMKTHCEKGCAILKNAPKDWSKEYVEIGEEICHYHHEKWDGKGYPEGLKGDEIPISAQIVSVADCFDALTTERVYKPAYNPDKALEMILNGECGAFSEKMMMAFKACKEMFTKHASNPNDYFIPTLATSQSHAVLNGYRILLVEDNNLSRDITKDIVEGEGAEVTEAVNGLEALNIIKSGDKGYFNAVLMDVNMPVMNGIQATSSIRALGSVYAQNVPIIALISSTDNEDIEACRLAGMNTYLTKPVSIKDLTKVLSEHIKDQV